MTKDKLATAKVPDQQTTREITEKETSGGARDRVGIYYDRMFAHS